VPSRFLCRVGRLGEDGEDGEEEQASSRYRLLTRTSIVTYLSTMATTDTSAAAVGAEIRRLRDALGMTLQEFARHVGIPWQTLQGYETGRVEPSAARLLLIVHRTRRSPEPFRMAMVARAVAAAA
jgi:DNA-binding transcriptional regulator YiaG